MDCGADTGFTSLDTGIVYLADTNISTGSTAQVTNNKQDFTTLRYFPADSSPVKNCYELSVDANTQYLVRAFFYHGSYVPAPSPSGNITFQVRPPLTAHNDLESIRNLGLHPVMSRLLTDVKCGGSPV